MGEGEEENMILRRDDLRGVDDLIAELALTRRARQRHLASAPGSRCGRRIVHRREPTQFDARQIDTCDCLLPTGHDDGCLCEHEIECRVYRVDADGREHYSTRPWSTRA